MSENVEPLVQAKEGFFGPLIRVFPTYIEVTKVAGDKKIVPMRQVQSVHLNWGKTTVTIHTHDDDIELTVSEAEEVQNSIARSLV